MRLSLILFLFAFQVIQITCQPITSVKDQRARLVPELDIIYVEWQGIPNTVFTVRHKSENSQSWKYIRTSNPNSRIPIDSYQNKEKVQIQIKNEKQNDEWTDVIVIEVIKKISSQSLALTPVAAHSPSAPVAVPFNPAQLQPPTQFTAKIMSPTSVQLKWQPVAAQDRKDIYYLVNVKQLTTSSGSTLQNQQIKTAATSFILGKMISGEKYEMTIRSATNQDKISGTAAIVEITMPREAEYFEIGNLIISSHFKTASQGVVNLTWQVPPTMINRIMAYHVEYTESGSENWQKIQFHGALSSAALSNLKSDTEYVLRIKTQLVNNIMTESGQFRFKTPRVEANPIQKVDVIYSHDINSVKLQWILKSHIQADKVAGYDVYMSEDKDLPDSQWKVIRLNNRESSLSMDDLKSKTVYYVRVNVRNIDGTIIRAPSVYRFRTIDTEDKEDVEGNSLSYRNVAPGQVEIRWTYPKHILDSVIGCTVIYSNRKDLSPDKWNKIEIEDSQSTVVNLRQLREGDRYMVQILPRLYTGDYDFSAVLSFDFKVDQLTPIHSPYARPMMQPRSYKL